MRRILFLAIILPCLASCSGLGGAGPAVPVPVERQDWARHFADAGVTGTMVLFKDGSGTAQVHDAGRAARGYLPASTFKIPNTMIILETGAANGPDEVFPWNGTKYEVAAWNKDLSFREAFAVSCVPVYQELARRVGQQRMEKWVKAARYGNENIGGGVDLFWLQGDLRISALEQVEFLQRLKHDRLPFSKKNMAIVKDFMVVEQGEGWTLRAKTGWAARSANIGWWVGWLERGNEVWYFALNIDIAKPEQLPARQGVVKAVLRGEGLLP